MLKYTLMVILMVLPTTLFSQSLGFSDDIYSIQNSLNLGNAEESYVLVNSLVESYPDSSKAWFLKSQIERQLFKYKPALESAKMALSLDPGHHPYYYLTASIYSELQLNKLSISYCDSILQKDSLHFLASVSRAKALVKEGMITEALNQYNKLHIRDSLNITFIKNIGSLHAKLDSLESAIFWYSKAILVDSTDISSYEHLGNLYVRTEDYKSGLPVLDRAIAMDTLNSWIYRFRGSLNIMSGVLDIAESDFRRAIQLGDSTAFAFRHLGLSLYKQSKYDEAFPVYQKTIELDPEDPKVWYYLGFCYKWKEDVEKALECMNKALALSVSPGISSIYNGLAQFHAIQREYPEAMHFYDLAYEWNNNDPVPLAQLGMLIEQTGGDKEKAKAYYDSYMEKSDHMDINLDNYIRNRLEIINEKLFFEGKLEKTDK